MISSFSIQMIGLYWHYKNGILAFQGGVMDQPKIYLDAMQIIDSTYNRIQAEKNGR